MIVQYDQDADAVFLKFREGKYYESKEINTNIIMDLDKERKVIGIEILNVSKMLPKEALSKMTFEILKPVSSTSRL